MEITLSVNNREEVLVLPVTPGSFEVEKPQGTEKFETVTGAELMLLGVPKLKKISWESFFPIRDYPYLHNRDMWGWDYVYMIDTWILKKLPIRLVISDTDINMAAAVADFKYSVKTDGDLWYTLEFEEFDLLDDDDSADESAEEELTVTQYEELSAKIDELTELINVVAYPMIYNYIDDNMPEWAKEPVQKAIAKGVLTTKDGELDLSYGDLRHLTWLDRVGLLD